MEKKYSAPAVSKLLDIIELMAEENRSFSINELSRLLSYPVNTVYRICMEMQERGYLEKDAESGQFALGGRFYTIGQIAGSRIELRTQALPQMQNLHEQIGETVHLTVIRNHRMILLDQLETKEPIRIYVETGSLLYPHASAFGKCLLAFCEQSFLEEYWREEAFPLTSKTITDLNHLKEELLEIRRRGFAFDKEEYMPGVVCVGAPIHSLAGEGIGAVGIVAPSFRFSEEKMQKSAGLVKSAAEKISASMGYHISIK